VGAVLRTANRTAAAPRLVALVAVFSLACVYVQPLSAQPHAVSYSQTSETFTPLAEWRIDLSYKFTNSISANVGYTGMYMDNITRASQTVDWFIPDLGILQGGNQDMFVNGVNFGFDVVY
jgi:hypothetical protein